MKSLKKILGTQAYWIVNKELAKKLGLGETLLLQHFIDLETLLADEGKPFYQQKDRILDKVPISKYKFTEYCKTLQKHDLLTIVKRGVPAKNHYTLSHDKIFNLLSTSQLPSSPLVNEPVVDKDKNQEDKNKEDNKTNTKWDILYDKIIVGYPKNRLQSKTPVIKLLKNLSKEEISLIIRNKDRYLKASNGYTKNLRKYIEEECWSESWLKAEEETKTKKTSITDNTKTFSGNY
tara:strand:- start:661 stop:1362 length:702 start_codon:yes stop_codon:yes gene_type:complete